ncbi:hypothetical protein FHG87_006692 [Trinorchestia longiramus]|nr:hypothetical protein FHG87_006692 [Trinorchestia longiramus]
MDQQLPQVPRRPSNKPCRKLPLPYASTPPPNVNLLRRNESTVKNEKLKNFQEFSFQSLPTISAPQTRTEVSRSSSDDLMFENANLNDSLDGSRGQVRVPGLYYDDFSYFSGMDSVHRANAQRCHRTFYSATRYERYHPYRRHTTTGVKFLQLPISDTETLDDYNERHSSGVIDCPNAKISNFMQNGNEVYESSESLAWTKISMDCELFLKWHSRCPLSHLCEQVSSYGRYVGDFTTCYDYQKTIDDEHWYSELVSPCKGVPMCVQLRDAHERVARWRVTLLVAGTLPPLQVSKISDLIEGSSCSGAGYSARSHDEVTGCLKVVTDLRDELHFPLVQLHPLPCEESWTLELAPTCTNYIRKLLRLSEMAHLQRSASESYSSNVLPPVGLERTSRLYAFKLMKNEKENVRKLLPYFIEKSKTDDKYVPFRPRKLSATKLETDKRKSDVCDVLMYRDPQSKHDPSVPEGHFENETSQTIRLCGVPLGNRPLTTSGNLFCTMRRSGTMRFTSPPASPLLSAGGSPSSSPQRRLVDRDCSAPPGTLPTNPARAGDSLLCASHVAPVADRHDAKNTPQGLHGDHQALVETVPVEMSVGLISLEGDDNSPPVEKNCGIVGTGSKFTSLEEKDPLDVRILSGVDDSTADKTRQPEKDDEPEANSILHPDVAPIDVGLPDLSFHLSDTPSQLEASSMENGYNSVYPAYGESNRALCRTINSVECMSTIPDLEIHPEQFNIDLEESTLNSTVSLQQRETASDICSRDPCLNSENIEVEVTGLAGQIGSQKIDISSSMEFIDQEGSNEAEIREYSFPKYLEGNATSVNHYTLPDISDELHNNDVNFPSNNMRLTESSCQNMVTVTEADNSELVQCEYSHDKVSSVCEPTEKNTMDVSSLGSQCVSSHKVEDIRGIEADRNFDPYITATENYQARGSSQSEIANELVVLEKLLNNTSCDCRSVTSPSFLESLVVTEPDQLESTSAPKSSLPSVANIQTSLEDENDMFEHPKLVSQENERSDPFCVDPKFSDSVSSSLSQAMGVPPEHRENSVTFPVASKNQEISTADGDQIQCSESDTSKINFNKEISLPISILEVSKDVEESPEDSNLDVLGVTYFVKSFEKVVNTFIDEDPDVSSCLLNEETIVEPGVSCSECNDLRLNKTDEVNGILLSTADNITTELSPESLHDQSPVKVAQCTTFIGSSFDPNELKITASSEKLLVQIDPLTCADAMKDGRVKPSFTETLESPSQTRTLTSNLEIIPMVKIDPKVNEDSLDSEIVTDGQTSLSINGVSDQVTEMSVCTININSICTTESVTCDIQPDNIETRVSDADALPPDRSSRPRNACTIDLNRGQALADRAAKIARMHGASPSKPRPFAFPADIIRSPSQISKHAHSPDVSKESSIDTCTIRSKSASPMTQKRIKRETTAKRLKSASPNNRLPIKLISHNCEPNGNSAKVPDSSFSTVTKPISTTESHCESKPLSFINTVYVKVPSTGNVDSSPEVSSPATYISNFTRVAYSDVTCNDKEVEDSVKQKTVRTELKLPRVSLIEEVEKVNNDLMRWASYIANKMLVEIFDFDSPEWKKDYFARVCPIPENAASSLDMQANHPCCDLTKEVHSPDSVSNDDSLSFVQEISQKGAATSAGNSASSADRRTGREEDSTASSSFSSEAWWGQGGPVTHREQLPLKEDVELVPQWPGLPVPSVPESDVDRTGYGSDEDFEAMDEDMRRLEEKIRQFEHELEEDLEMSLAEEDSHRMPNFGLLDKAKLRSSPLPTQYPPVCMNKTKHFSFMSKKDIDDYLKTDSESGSSSSSSFDDDMFFAKKKIKLKPGDRKCFSLDLKKRSLLDECKSECLMKILSIPENDSKIERIPDDVAAKSKLSERETSEVCLIENEFKMTGQYWRSEDGLAVVDSEGLADFYAGANPCGVCFIFEDESDDEDTLDASIAVAFGKPDIPHDEPLLEPCRIPTPTENNGDSDAIQTERSTFKTDKKSKFVSSFKNSFVKATKSIGPKFGGKLNECSYENPVQGGANSPLIDPASVISDILSGKTKPDSVTSKTVCVADNVATFPASGESDACDSSVISGEYYASPAICILSDEDSHVPEYNLFHQLSPRKEEQLLSSLSAPTPPIRKSSLDAVSSTPGSFRRQSGGKQEATPHRMVDEIPRVLPPPPCVPPRTTTLNYYPIRPSGPRPPQSGS